MFVLLFSVILILPMINAASSMKISNDDRMYSLYLDCNVCQLENYFVESNGYACFRLSDDSTACTCPDRQYSINKPCRRRLFI